MRLLSKLHSYGFRDPLLGWLKSFLIGRRQRVCVHDTVSLWHNVTCGIPQGSVLRPVLFLLYINDLPDNVTSNVYMFADDTKIYRPMTSHEDTTILQNDLDCLQSWSAKWLLNFNLHKCKVMSITKSTACNHDSADYYLLVSYLFSIGDPRHPSPLCPLCLMHDHTSSHLFECKSLPTSLSSLDLWTNPDKVEPFLATWGERLLAAT